jgi:hypothetical protein
VKGGDYKFGFLPVDHPDVNIQVQSYSLGMFEKYPWAKEVEFHLMLPRQKNHHIVAKYRREHMEQIAFRIDNIIKQRQKGIRRVFMDCCKYCDLSTDCPALLPRLHPLLKLYASSSSDLKVQNAGIVFDPEAMVQHSPEAISRFIRVLDFLEKIRGRARDWGRDFVLDGNEIPDYFLVKRAPKAKRPYSDTRKVVEIACKEFGVDPLDIIEAVPQIAKGVMEGCVKDTAEKGKGAATIRAFNQRIDTEKLWYDPDKNPENMICFLKAKAEPKAPKRKPNKIPAAPKKTAPVLVTKKKVTKK